MKNNTEVVQQAGEHQIVEPRFGQANQGSGFTGDHGDAFAVLEVIDADQVEGIGQGKQGTSEGNPDGHRALIDGAGVM